MVTGSFGLFLLEGSLGTSIEEARTVAVNTLVMFEIFYVFNSRYLYHLVADAIKGTDSSFYKAVHIDKNIIDVIPYFKQRYKLARDEGDKKFLESIGSRISSPHFMGRIRHCQLYIIFAILDNTGWLDKLTAGQICDFCVALSLDRKKNLIESEIALRKRLHEYRKFQSINNMSMP